MKHYGGIGWKEAFSQGSEIKQMGFHIYNNTISASSFPDSREINCARKEREAQQSLHQRKKTLQNKLFVTICLLIQKKCLSLQQIYTNK